jgi:hypothetical protein
VKAQLLDLVAADVIRTAICPTTPGFAGLIDRFLVDRSPDQGGLRVDRPAVPPGPAFLGFTVLQTQSHADRLVR